MILDYLLALIFLSWAVLGICTGDNYLILGGTFAAYYVTVVMDRKRKEATDDRQT